MLPRLATLLAVLLLSVQLPAEEYPLGRSLESILKQSKLAADDYGIRVEDLRSGKVLYDHNGGKAFNPASTIKLLTAGTALEKLGPNFQFHTTVLRGGNDVCLKGGGDPSLVTERMWMLVEEARHAGVTQIKGDLLLDTSSYGKVEPGKAFTRDQERSFMAPFSSLSINYNSVTIHARPGPLGKAPEVWLEPDLPAFEIRNKARTMTGAGPRDLGGVVKFQPPDRLIVDVWGKVPLGAKEVKIYRGVPEPAFYAGQVFLDHLRRAGGTFAGKVREAPCPAKAEEIVSFPSLPLSQIVGGLNKFSNNIIAEMLLHAVGERPTADSGSAAVRAWLTSNGIQAPELVFQNASGLSYGNRVSARTLAQVIHVVANDLRFGPEFLSSLGIAGVDGTMRRRLAKSDAATRIRAKSGSLSGVVTLAGVAASPRGDTVFSFLFNVPESREWDAQAIEDRLLDAIVAALPE